MEETYDLFQLPNWKRGLEVKAGNALNKIKKDKGITSDASITITYLEKLHSSGKYKEKAWPRGTPKEVVTWFNIRDRGLASGSTVIEGTPT